MINVPQEFALNPTLVEVLTALDQVQHPPQECVDQPRDVYGQIITVKAPAETLRSHLVSWHNQLVTAQRAKSDADERAIGFQKVADNQRREIEGLKQKVAELQQVADAATARAQELDAQRLQLLTERVSAADARLAVGKKAVRR